MKLKKIISLCIIASLSVSAIGLNVFSENISKYDTAMQTLNDLGIIDGDENGSLNPNLNVTRAETAKIITESLTDGILPNADITFFDVPGDYWGVSYIKKGVYDGFIDGYDENTFGPEDNVTFNQAVKMIVSAINYTGDSKADGGYPEGYIKTAEKLGIINSGFDKPDEDRIITREELAYLIYSTLEVPLTVIGDVLILPDGTKITESSVSDGTGIDYDSALSMYKNIYVLEGYVSIDSNDKYIINVTYSRRLKNKFIDENTESSNMYSASFKNNPELKNGDKIKAYVTVDNDKLNVISYHKI